MSGGILSTATSGLMSFQRSLQTISHNIVNANTEGYSRQRTDLVQRLPSFTGAGYVGNGVEVAAIRRNYDDFLTKQVRSNTSAQAQSEAYATLAKQVDTFIADDSINLGSVMQNFFNAVQDVATDPTSIAARQSMLGQADNLATRFQSVNARFDEIRDQVNTNLSDLVSQINSAAKSIAGLNDEINVAMARGQTPNDLLDQRDQLIEDLSKKVGVTVIPNGNGLVDVVIGNGQALVLGSNYNQLAVQASAYNEPKDVDIAIVSPAGKVPITSSLSGGAVGGVLAFRDQVLNAAQNAVGRIAAGFATDFNLQHTQGYDLNGVPGGAFFTTPPSAVVFGKSTNASTITASLANTSQLTTADYRLDIAGGNYQLFDATTGALVVSGVAPPGGPINLTTTTPAVGLMITVNSGALTNGDSFMIRPTRATAGLLKAVITDPKKIAAAGGVPPAVFNGVGDNANAKALAALQQATKLAGGTASYQDAYGVMVSVVGTNTRTAQVDSEAQKRLLDHSLEARQQVSGVNLDEEAANLVQFQQAYQASAQLVSAVNSMFDALIGAVRR